MHIGVPPGVPCPVPWRVPRTQPEAVGAAWHSTPRAGPCVPCARLRGLPALGTVCRGVGQSCVRCNLAVQRARGSARATGTGVPAFRGDKCTSGTSRAAAPLSPRSRWEIQPWQAGGGTWCSAEAELSGAGTSWLWRLGTPGKSWHAEDSWQQLPFPLAAPSQPHANTGETKAGAAAGGGLRRGCWRNGTAAFPLLPHRIFRGCQAWGPWAQPLPAKPWGAVCSALSFPCMFPEPRVWKLQYFLWSASLSKYKFRSTGSFQNETSHHSLKMIWVCIR